MTSSEFISIEEIVSEAASLISDEGFKLANFGYYIMAAHRAVEELSIDTFYKKVTVDTFDWNECGDLKFEMPKNLFNIKEVYLFNSSCKTKCNCSDKSCWNSFAIAHWKRQFNTFGSSGIATAKVLNGGRDELQPKYVNSGSLIYYGIQENQMCFSDSAKGYKNIRIVANGFASSNSDLPVIPRLARNFIVSAVKERVLYRRKHIDKSSRLDWGDALQEKENNSVIARRRLRMLNGAEKESMMSYLSFIDTK